MTIDRKKKLRIIAAILSVILITSVVLNQTGLLKDTQAEDTWSGDMPSSDTGYTFGKDGNKVGTGKENNPYIISSAADLAQLCANVNAGTNYEGVYFKQTVDIVLSAGTWTAIGTASRSFKGNYNGNGCAIKGLKVDSAAQNQGLFGHIYNAKISNLTVQGTINGGTNAGGIVGLCEDSSLTACSFSGSVNGTSYVGGIAGTIDGNKCVVNNCSVAYGATVMANGGAVGGVAGYLTRGKLINCNNQATVQLTASGLGDASKASASGLVGYVASSGQIVNSYNWGIVSSTSYMASGIASGEDCIIYNCYNNASVSGATVEGSIAASIKGISVLDHVFYQNGTTLATNGGVGEGQGNVTTANTIGVIGSDKKVKTAGWGTWGITQEEVTLKAALDSYHELPANITKHNGLMLSWKDAADGYPTLSDIAAHEHTKSKSQVIEKATCTKAGVIQWTCGQCNHTWQEPIEAKGHTPVKDRVEATCEEDGYDNSVCQDCGEVLSNKVLPKTGHSGDQGVYEDYRLANTCTTDGYTVKRCTYCHKEYESTKQVIPASGHAFTVEKKHIDATCTEPEMSIQECEVCKEVRTLSGPAVNNITGVKMDAALGHSWGESFKQEVTCSQKGGTIHVCGRCNEVEFLDTPQPEMDHEYTVTGETVVATCTDRGYTVMSCKYGCGKSINTNYVNALGHDWLADGGTELTCGQDETVHYTCQRCKDEKTETIATATNNHTWKVVEQIDAECFKAGSITRECRVCKKQDTQPIAQIGHHDYVTADALTVEVDCEHDGEIWEKCRVCGNEQFKELISSPGHHYVEETVKATCTNGGYTTRLCDRIWNGEKCTFSERVSETIALGHDLSKVTLIAPTTATMGYTVKGCSRCDYEEESDYIAATPCATYDAVTATLTFNPESEQEIEPVTLFLELLSDEEQETGEEMKYSLNGVDWVTTDALSVVVTEDELLFTTDSALKEAKIYVQRPGNTASETKPYAESEVQVLVLERAEMAPTAVIVGNAPTTKDGKGTITGVDETMEYRAKSDKTWTSVTGNKIENLEPGYYYVRIKATPSKLAGEEQEIYIPAYGSDDNSSDKPGTDDDSSNKPGTDDDSSNKPGTDDDSSNKPGTDDDSSNKPGTDDGSSNKPSGDNQNNGNNSNGSTNDGNSGNASDAGGTGNSSNVSGNNSDDGSGSANQAGSLTVGSGSLSPNNVYYSGNGGNKTSSSSSSSKVTSAKTGDSTNLSTWLIVAGVALFAVAAVTTKRRQDVQE